MSARKPPTTVRVSFWCWLAGAALFICQLVVPLLVHWSTAVGEIQRQAEASGTPVPDNQRMLVAQLFVVVMFVTGAVLAVPFVLTAFGMRAGRPRARAVLDLLGGIGLIMHVLSLLNVSNVVSPFIGTDTPGPIDLLLPPLVLIAAAGGLVLMHQQDANEYFKARKA